MVPEPSAMGKMPMPRATEGRVCLKTLGNAAPDIGDKQISTREMAFASPS